MSEKVEDKAPDDRTDNAKNDVHHQAFAGFVDDLACDEACDKAYDEPREYRHVCPLVLNAIVLAQGKVRRRATRSIPRR
jgi:hypothetical protein